MHHRRDSVRPLASRAFCGLALCLWLTAAAGHAEPAPLAEQIEALLSEGPLARADVGIHVVALGTGRVIYARHQTRPFVAASNAKLVTAAAALDALGEGYEFETTVYADGQPQGGVLRGDLVLRGGGDPTIGGRYDDEDAMEVLGRWARVLRARGLRRVTGDVVADDTFFDRVLRHPQWGDYPAWKWYYTCTSALSINDNCVEVLVRPGAAPGRPALVSVTPSSAPVTLRNTCETSSRLHAIWFDREAGGRVIRVGGNVRINTAGYRDEVTVPDPPLYAAAAFRQALQEAGVSVDGGVRLIEPARAGAVRQRWGEPLLVRRTALPPVLSTMLKRSHNHYAEQVVKTIGAEAEGAGTWAAGLARAGRMLREMGLGPADFELSDGSGLSRDNRLTPIALTTLLVRVRAGKHGPTFAASLPAAGRDGTLKSRLTEEPYAGNVRAKTGYLDGVGALSGYATARSGIRVAFAILVNDAHNPPGTYSMRQTLDGLCRLIVDHAE